VKYEVDRFGWWGEKSPHPQCWKSILNGLHKFKFVVNFEVKNGAKVLFWHNVRCGDQHLKDPFPDLFRMTLFKDAIVQQVVSWNDDQNLCYITLSRSPSDWEEFSVLNLWLCSLVLRLQ